MPLPYFCDHADIFILMRVSALKKFITFVDVEKLKKLCYNYSRISVCILEYYVFYYDMQI